MKYIYIFIGFVLISFSDDNQKVRPRNFHRLEGSWKGRLTYLDYTSNKKVIIPADLLVQRSSEKNSWIFQTVYPGEPHANSTDTVVIRKGGKMINDEVVIHRSNRKGKFTVITEKDTDDNGIIKSFRFTYSIEKNRFSMQKEERKQGHTEYIFRNRYDFAR